ncbi:MAG TPA: dihydrofolate reductase family protein [Armatimonadaceae bacterium]|nr:dihydrofolate reductase family protein [Armatimonadaceae bacterium]
MRRVVSLMHMSLDGYVEGSNAEMDWIKIEESVFAFVDRFISRVGTALYGPKTFGMMEAYWPSVLDDATATGHTMRHARWYADAEKVVFSRSRTDLGGTSSSARLISGGNLAGELTALKQGEGKDIMIFGSPGLTHSCLEAGLVDEIVMTVSPVLLGAGTAMFPAGMSRTDLQLLEVVPFAAGSVGSHYRLAKAAGTA